MPGDASGSATTPVARGSRRNQVRPHAGLQRCAASPARPPGDGPRPVRSAAGEGPGHGGAAARVHRHPGGQRRIRARRPVVRPHDASRPPRGGVGRHAPLPVPRQEPQGAPGGPQRPAARAHRGALPGVPGSACFSTSTTTAREWRSARGASTTTCGRLPVRTSRPRTSAPGPVPAGRGGARSHRHLGLGTGGQVRDSQGHRSGGRTAQQHPGRLPEILRASRGARELSGRHPACRPAQRHGAEDIRPSAPRSRPSSGCSATSPTDLGQGAPYPPPPVPPPPMPLPPVPELVPAAVTVMVPCMTCAPWMVQW